MRGDTLRSRPALGMHVSEIIARLPASPYQEEQLMCRREARAKEAANPTEILKNHVSRVIAVDHLVVRVSDYDKSKHFYARLFDFLGFEIIDDFSNMTGWRNGGRPSGFPRPAATGGNIAMTT